MGSSKPTPPSNTSPPAKRRRLSPTANLTKSPSSPPKLIPSPFSLTTIDSLPDSHNISTISLPSILSDPLLREVWIFNYLHSIPFILSNLDPDTASTVKVHVVHGFWKTEDPNRLALHQDASQHHNVFLHCAPMPEMFGTHHSKMFILLRHDHHAQIVIHTANMIPKDWENMTQGVWRSPLLPLLRLNKGEQKNVSFGAKSLTFGSGAKFKFDLLQYLKAYDSRPGRTVTKALREDLVKYDFSAVKGSLIASVPGRFNAAPDSIQTTQWGTRGLSNALKQIQIRESEKERGAHVVVQISSVATLGPTDVWIRENLIESLEARNGSTVKTQLRTKVVFPTTDEIRRSLDGYKSGSSIHWKLQSAQHKRQLEYMRPMLHHWANDAETDPCVANESQDSGRNRAAPHIKTYMRFNSEGTIDWALLTSANVSKQAWGYLKNRTGEIHISSWEIGLLVWPGLYGDHNNTKMVPTFRTNNPSPEGLHDGETVIAVRMPYSLPLKKYDKDMVPWVSTNTHSQVDWRGVAWAV